MKKTILPLILVMLWSASLPAQRLPDYGLNRTRITEPDGRSQLIETRPAKTRRMDERKTYYWYSANRVHTTQGGYSGKLLNGPYQQFDGAKNLRERGTFREGLKSGTWKAWNENGRLTSETAWRRGNRQGAFSFYDSDGKLIRAGRYKKDLVSGKVLVYSGSDSLSTLRYKAGRELPGRSPSARPSFFKRLWPFGRKGSKKDTAGRRDKGITGNIIPGSSGTRANNPDPAIQSAGRPGGTGSPAAEKTKRRKKVSLKKSGSETGTARQ